MHALNNALGQPFFDAADMQFAAETFMAEDGFEIGDALSDHVRAHGWYSSEVLATALRTAAMHKYDRLRWQLHLAPARTRHDVEACVGALQNRTNTHWVALCSLNDGIYEFDSLCSAPKLLSEESLLHLLHVHPAYCIHAI